MSWAIIYANFLGRPHLDKLKKVESAIKIQALSRAASRGPPSKPAPVSVPDMSEDMSAAATKIQTAHAVRWRAASHASKRI